MKILTVTLGIMIITAFAFGQTDYKVIKVNGTILIQKTNSALETGTIFSDNENLEFKTANARAAVINPTKGRFVLMPDNSDLAYAKANFTPAMSNISSRGGNMGSLNDLENEFSGKYAILDKVTIKVNKELFPMTENKFFYIRYEYKGETINKKLTSKEDTLIVDKQELLTVDGNPIPNPDISKMEILYMEKDENNKRTLISEFDPVFLNGEELLNEVKIILNEFKDIPKEDRISEVIAYINDFYGKPNKENITEWLEKNVNF